MNGADYSDAPYSHDDSRVLLDVCNPQLYIQNAFRVTGVQVDVGVRGLKRHLDDMKASLEFGETDVARHAFVPRPLTVEHVRDAAIRLADPKRRLVDELFWFWPAIWGQSKDDGALLALAKGDKRAAIRIWLELARTNDDVARVVAYHNLAVVHHMVALDWELKCLKDHKSVSIEELKKADDCWTRAFGYWNTIWDDELLWSMMAAKVRRIDDPRLTTGFVRRMRQYLPEAILQVTGILAAEFSRINNQERASAHIMALRMYASDRVDISSILAALTSPLHTRIDTALGVAIERIRSEPERGADKARELYDATAEPLQTLKVLLGQDAAEVAEVRDAVASAYRSCVVAYGNASEDWATCVDLLHVGIPIPASETLTRQLREDYETVKERKTQKDLVGMCWFCKKKKADPVAVVPVPMYGNVHRTTSFAGTHVTWNKTTVEVPRCSDCSKGHQRRSNRGWACACLGAVTGVIVGAVIPSLSESDFNPPLVAIGGVGGFLAGWFVLAPWVEAVRPTGVSPISNKLQFPAVRDLIIEGWAVGAKPYGVS